MDIIELDYRCAGAIVQIDPQPSRFPPTPQRTRETSFHRTALFVHQSSSIPAVPPLCVLASEQPTIMFLSTVTLPFAFR